MKDTSEVPESPEKQITKSPEKSIDTFDDLRKTDNSGRIDTFDDIRKKGSDNSIKTFDDLRTSKESGDKTKNADIADNGVKDLPESERFNTYSTLTKQTSIENGRHRIYVAMKEGYFDNPVNVNDVYQYGDGKQLVDKKGIEYVSFNYDILKSQDMQDMMKEHDFNKWEEGKIDHKGFTYNDHVKEFERLKECKEFIMKNGHSPNEIDSALGKEHADTYKRFYETDPIKIDRFIEMN